MIEQRTAPLPLLSDAERAAIERCELDGPLAVRFVCEQRGIVLPLREALVLMVEYVDPPIPSPTPPAPPVPAVPSEAELIQRGRRMEREELACMAVIYGGTVCAGVLLGYLLLEIATRLGRG